MASPNQITANRQNSLRSTGPRTPEGKSIASRNSIKHGFYSTSVVLPNEDRDEFMRLARRLVSAYNPCGVREEELVRSIIETRWQLRRANVVDSELFQIYGFYKGQNRGVGTAFAQDATQGNAFTKLTRYQGFLLRKLKQTEEELAQLQTERAKAVSLSTLTISVPGAEFGETKTSLAPPIDSSSQDKTVGPTPDRSRLFGLKPVTRMLSLFSV